MMRFAMELFACAKRITFRTIIHADEKHGSPMIPHEGAFSLGDGMLGIIAVPDR